MLQDRWTNCYLGGWNGLVVPEAFAHPAKFSRTLIQRIYQHAFAEGWLVPGVSTVLDPFSGVALGAHDGALAGMRHVSVELEARFVALAQANIDLWQRKYGHLPQWVTPICVQGDSRELLRVLSGAGVDCCVSSPPFCDSDGRKGGSDLYRQKAIQTGRNPEGYAAQGHTTPTPYGTTPGNLGNMAPGTVEAVVQQGQVDGLVSSPPYAEGLGHKRGAAADQKEWDTKSIGSTSYGSTPGNLGNMAPGSVETEQHSTFWAASRTILAQCYALLTPGGHAIWVVKSYCRDGAIVDFPGQWRAVCEDVGFVTLHEHHVMLVEDYGTQGGLFGEDTVHQTARKSFFRRLHEAKRPDLAIDYEVVLCMQKPGGGGEGERHGVEACVSSPPYAEAIQNGCSGIDKTKGVDPRDPQSLSVRRMEELAEGYGSTPGQLGAMKPGTVPGKTS